MRDCGYKLTPQQAADELSRCAALKITRNEYGFASVHRQWPLRRFIETYAGRSVRAPCCAVGDDVEMEQLVRGRHRGFLERNLAARVFVYADEYNAVARVFDFDLRMFAELPLGAVLAIARGGIPEADLQANYFAHASPLRESPVMRPNVLALETHHDRLSEAVRPTYVHAARAYQAVANYLRTEDPTELRLAPNHGEVDALVDALVKRGLWVKLACGAPVPSSLSRSKAPSASRLFPILSFASLLAHDAPPGRGGRGGQGSRPSVAVQALAYEELASGGAFAAGGANIICIKMGAFYAPVLPTAAPPARAETLELVDRHTTRPLMRADDRLRDLASRVTVGAPAATPLAVVLLFANLDALARAKWFDHVLAPGVKLLQAAADWVRDAVGDRADHARFYACRVSRPPQSAGGR